MRFKSIGFVRTFWQNKFCSVILNVCIKRPLRKITPIRIIGIIIYSEYLTFLLPYKIGVTNRIGIH